MSGVSEGSQPDHKQPLQDLLDWINRRTIDSYDIKTGTPVNDPSRKFMPNSAVETHFQENQYRRTKELLEAVFPGGDGPTAKDVADTCPRIFCILALIGKAKYIGLFAAKDALSDGALPFEPGSQKFPKSTSDPNFFEAFNRHQWRFCARDLTRRHLVEFEDEHILPFTELRKVGGGGSATVYKATVQKNHDKMTFTTREGDFGQELDAFKKITAHGTRTTENLIEFYGSFKYRKTFNIVLEYAEGGTLEQYLQQHEPPGDVHRIIDFWEAIFGVCGALRRIHESYLAPDKQGRWVLLQGWHQDLKPANILVVKRNSPSGFGWTFKIADLGLAHFKRILEGQEEAVDLDTKGTRTYGAPECYAESSRTVDRRNLVKRSIDIWSLGAIYSEVAVWVANGFSAVETYRKARMQATSQLTIPLRDGDCFHDGHERLRVIDNYHEDISNDMDPDDSLTGFVLFMIGKEMLNSSPDLRPRAEHLVSKTDELVKQARASLAGQYSRSQRRMDRADFQGPATSYHEPFASTSGHALEGFGQMNITQSPQNTVNFPNRGAFPYPQPGSLTDSRGLQQYHPHPVTSMSHAHGPSIHTGAGFTHPPPNDATPDGPRQEIESPPVCTVEQAWHWYKERKYNRDARLPHEGLLPELDGRDHVFIIDDSESMGKYWKEVEKLAQLLAFITKKMDKDGLELYFFSGNDRGHTCRDSSKVARLIRERSPNKMTNLNSRLATDLRLYRDKIDESRVQSRFKRGSILGRPVLKQRSIYVFTDGVLRSGDEDQGQEAIIQTAGKLAEVGFDREQIGIQFIRFGEDERGVKRLEALDNLKTTHGLAKDIVDTEPATGNVWKMLLGAINPKFDNDPK